MPAARMIVTTVKAAQGRGTTSAMTIPIAAMSAKPTNGCRDAFRNFIVLLFLHFLAATQALISLDCVEGGCCSPAEAGADRDSSVREPARESRGLRP